MNKAVINRYPNGLITHSDRVRHVYFFKGKCGAADIDRCDSTEKKADGILV